MNRFVAEILEMHDEGFGGWAKGYARVNSRNYRYEVKHFAVGSQFGIQGGRVSKLWIRREYDNKPPRVVCNYDRGWDIKPRMYSPATMAVYNALLAKYN